MESWFDFDRDGDDEKEKEDEEKDVFLLVTTSSDDAIRVHDVRAKKCGGRYRRFVLLRQPKLIRVPRRVHASRYSAKKQQQNRCGHGKGVEVCVVEREKQNEGVLLPAIGDGVMYVEVSRAYSATVLAIIIIITTSR